MMIHATTLPGQSSANIEPPADFKEPANALAAANGDDDLQHFKHLVNEMLSQVKMLEHKVQDVEHIYSSNRKKLSMNPKNKERGKRIISIKKHQDHTPPSENMQELIYQFGKILNQVIQKKNILDEDLGLQNCSEFDGKPRDFSEIKRRIEMKDGAGYKNVRDIYHDVRSVLKNAMKYNDVRSDAHVTAETLMENFREKWLLLFPKVMLEEERMEADQAVQLTNHAQIAKEISCELFAVEERLNEVKQLVLQKCRKMTTLEKRELGKSLVKLSPDDLGQALKIVAECNPAFQANAEEVDLDIDAQSEYTLRMLKYFISDVKQAQENHLRSVGLVNIDTNTDKVLNSNFKRKREVIDVGGKTAKKKIKARN